MLLYNKGMQILVCLLTLLFTFQVMPDAGLAKQYAPVIYQGLGPDPAADEFTRVDFDGDWNPDNNWDNMPLFPRPRTVYWDMMESENHYFITYAFYYPRDYAGFCIWIHCHENDFEGMRVTIRKPSKVIKLEGLAHNFKSEVLDPSVVEISIEKEGHGIHPLLLRKPDENHTRYTPADYELRPLKELWDKRNSSLFTGHFKYKGKTYPANFGGKKWILFGYGAAKPPWSWEIWRSEIEKGQWYLDPLKGSKEKYMKQMVND
jgi:hypothetical protein